MPDDLYLDTDEPEAREALELYWRLIERTNPRQSRRIRQIVRHDAKVNEIRRWSELYDSNSQEPKHRASEIFAALTDENGVLQVPPSCRGQDDTGPDIREVGRPNLRGRRIPGTI